MASPAYSKYKSELFLLAARKGDLEAVAKLSKDPEVNINWKDERSECTALHHACYNYKTDVIKFLLKLDGVEVNPSSRMGLTPFQVVCRNGYIEAASLMLADQRIDTNKGDINKKFTPLWLAAYNGHDEIVERLLASGRHIDTKTAETRNNTTAYQISKDRGYNSISDLLEAFDKNPAGVARDLRKKLGFQDNDIGSLFALIVYVADGYLRTREANHSASRFFAIASKLPMEIQMMLCHVAFESVDCIVKTANSEPAFREYAK